MSILDDILSQLSTESTDIVPEVTPEANVEESNSEEEEDPDSFSGIFGRVFDSLNKTSTVSDEGRKEDRAAIRQAYREDSQFYSNSDGIAGFLKHLVRL